MEARKTVRPQVGEGKRYRCRTQSPFFSTKYPALCPSPSPFISHSSSLSAPLPNHWALLPTIFIPPLPSRPPPCRAEGRQYRLGAEQREWRSPWRIPEQALSCPGWDSPSSRSWLLLRSAPRSSRTPAWSRYSCPGWQSSLPTRSYSEGRKTRAQPGNQSGGAPSQPSCPMGPESAMWALKGKSGCWG